MATNKREKRYLPRPQDWEWEKLAESDILARLKGVETTLENILAEQRGLDVEAKKARDELWKILRAKPEPGKVLAPGEYRGSMGEVQRQKKVLEDIASDSRRLAREASQARKAIDEIRKRISGDLGQKVLSQSA